MLDILLPFHGRPDHFREAVLSVVGQSSPHWRLIVVDDAYPEDVAPWLDALGDDRISYHRNPSNVGIAANFQRCLELATADHVVFLGCDDRLRPSYVDVVTGAARRSGATMVQPGVAVIDAVGRAAQPLADRVKRRLQSRLPHGVPLSGEHVASSIMHGAWTYFPAICWEREAVLRHGFDAGHKFALDVAMISALLRDGGSIELVDDVCFEYRRHHASASVAAVHDADRFQRERVFFSQMAAEFDALGWRRAARAARWHTTSRLHAITALPRALGGGNGAAALALVGHVVS